MLARDAGEPLVAIAALVQRPLTSIVALHSKHITKPQELRGKKIGDAGIPYQQAYLKTILARAGVPAGSVKDINVGANLVPAMLSGRVDATLGAYWNYEAIQLRQAGKKPDVIRVDNAGVPPTTSWSWWCASTRSPTRPTSCAGSCRRSGAATRRCAPTPAPASMR